MRRGWPQRKPPHPSRLVAYLHRCGERLGDVLTGSESALNTLFPDGSYETVDFLYNGWSAARYMNGVARAAARQALAWARWGNLCVWRSARAPGGTAAALLPALAEWPTRYLFTDVSDFFLACAASALPPILLWSMACSTLKSRPLRRGSRCTAMRWWWRPMCSMLRAI